MKKSLIFGFCFFLSFCCFLILSSQATAYQNSFGLNPNEFERQTTFLSTNSNQSVPKDVEAEALLDQADRSYKSSNFEEAEKSLKKILFETFKEELEKPLSLKIPNPGGVREEGFSIPFIFRLVA